MSKIPPRPSDDRRTDVHLAMTPERLAAMRGQETVMMPSRFSALTAEPKDQTPSRGRELALVDRESPPLRPIREQYDALCQLGLLHPTSTIELPRIDDRPRRSVFEGFLLIPCAETIASTYNNALARVLTLLQTTIPVWYINVPINLLYEPSLALHTPTVKNITRGERSGDTVKLLPVQLGGRHLGIDFQLLLRTMRCSEWGLDLLTVCIYLLTHADILGGCDVHERYCSIACAGSVISAREAVMPLVPTIRFLDGGICLTALPSKVPHIDVGMATGADASILQRLRTR